jgi:hypothetical protein
MKFLKNFNRKNQLLTIFNISMIGDKNKIMYFLFNFKKLVLK